MSCACHSAAFKQWSATQNAGQNGWQSATGRDNIVSSTPIAMMNPAFIISMSAGHANNLPTIALRPSLQDNHPSTKPMTRYSRMTDRSDRNAAPPTITLSEEAQRKYDERVGSQGVGVSRSTKYPEFSGDKSSSSSGEREISTVGTFCATPSGNTSNLQNRVLLYVALREASGSKEAARRIASFLKTECSDYLITPIDDEAQKGWADHGLSLSDSCCFAILGWEGGGGVRWSTWKDEKTKKYLLDHGDVADADPTGKYAMKWNPAFGQTTNNRRMHRLMRDAIAYRMGHLVGYMSLGPTQTWLHHSGIDPSGNQRSPWTGKWEQLWSRYYAPQWEAEAKFLLSFYFPSGKWADVHPLNDDQYIAWLAANHTGNGKGKTGNSIAQDYYWGAGDYVANGGWKQSYLGLGAFLDTPTK